MKTVPQHSVDSITRHGEMSMRSLGPFLAACWLTCSVIRRSARSTKHADKIPAR